MSDPHKPEKGRFAPLYNLSQAASSSQAPSAVSSASDTNTIGTTHETCRGSVTLNVQASGQAAQSATASPTIGLNVGTQSTESSGTKSKASFADLLSAANDSGMLPAGGAQTFDPNRGLKPGIGAATAHTMPHQQWTQGSSASNYSAFKTPAATTVAETPVSGRSSGKSSMRRPDRPRIGEFLQTRAGRGLCFWCPCAHRVA